MLDGAPGWPTANAGNFNDREDPTSWLARREHHASKEENATRASLSLAMAVKLWGYWPTATTQDAHASARHGYMVTGHTGTTLLDAIRQWATDWPTPMAKDGERGMGSLFMRGNPTLGAAAKRCASHLDLSTWEVGPDGSPLVVLHPCFVETLMGFPIGWTSLPRSETLSFLW